MPSLWFVWFRILGARVYGLKLMIQNQMNLNEPTDQLSYNWHFSHTRTVEPHRNHQPQNYSTPPMTDFGELFSNAFEFNWFTGRQSWHIVACGRYPNPFWRKHNTIMKSHVFYLKILFHLVRAYENTAHALSEFRLALPCHPRWRQFVDAIAIFFRISERVFHNFNNYACN